VASKELENVISMSSMDAGLDHDYDEPSGSSGGGGGSVLH